MALKVPGRDQKRGADNFCTRPLCRPPPKGVARKASRQAFAISTPVSRAPIASTFASLRDVRFRDIFLIGFVYITAFSMMNVSIAFLWQQRYKRRVELAQLTEADFHDVGASWSDFADEANKPFWRA